MRSRRFRGGARCAGALLPVALAACGGGGSSVPSAPPIGPVSNVPLALELVATDVVFPTHLAAPDGDPRLFVAERGGRIRVISDGVVRLRPYLDLSALVSTSGERGLYSLAFDPGYATNGRVYVAYADLAGDLRVERYLTSPSDPNVALPDADAVVLRVDLQQPFHHGGQLAFGPDGLLYVAVGDGGSPGNAFATGQDPGDLLGSILRIDVAIAGAGYDVPADNPFLAVPGARPELWSIGLRNPWRFSFDRANGDLYVADVGEDAWEEIDVVPAPDGAGAGANFGWSVLEGPACFDPPGGCDATGFVAPAWSYAHGEDDCCVVGGYVYRGAAIPELAGTYFFADLCSSKIRSLRWTGGRATEVKVWTHLFTGGSITSFGEDGAGELYVLTNWGGVFRVVRA